MRKLKLYLETSVWGFYFADDAPEKKEVTRRFFGNLAALPYAVYLSETVLEEISRAPEDMATALSELISRHDPSMLALNSEVSRLASEYMKKGALPSKALYDALHLAYASVYELDCVVSWNLRHIANLRRQEKIQGINLLNGYTKPIQLITPMEVSEDERLED